MSPTFKPTCLPQTSPPLSLNFFTTPHSSLFCLLPPYSSPCDARALALYRHKQKRKGDLLLKQNVLRLEITMDHLCLTKQTQPTQQLLRKHSDQRSAQSSELVLLDQLVQINAQQLEHQTQMLAMDEGVFQAQEMMVVVLVHLFVQLGSG